MSAPVVAGDPGLEAAVQARLHQFAREEVIDRVWANDASVWRGDANEIGGLLGWLTVAERMAAEIERLQEFARGVHKDGIDAVVLSGMGGSSLGASVLATMLGRGQLHILDTTEPGRIAALTRSLDLERTLFIFSSKSGGTIETRSHLEHFWLLSGDPSRFVAITDAGSALAELARERGFRVVFEEPGDIGGRYSVLSHFGLVPGVLVGVDIAAVLAGANEMVERCRQLTTDNPGARLGAALGEAGLAGRWRIACEPGGEWRALYPWIEQLVAESTGKDGRGLLPCPAPADPSGEGWPGALAAGGAGGPDLPSVALDYGEADARALGAAFFLWEFATALAGQVLGVNPFDQPDVEAAKVAARRALESPGALRLETPPLAGCLASIGAGDYVALQVFAPWDEELRATLAEARGRLERRYGVPVTVGEGPAFLHSTGQLHKGGPDACVFIQVVGEPADDVPIPGAPYTFGQLYRAQADGDLDALNALGRRVARVRIEDLAGV